MFRGKEIGGFVYLAWSLWLFGCWTSDGVWRFVPCMQVWHISSGKLRISAKGNAFVGGDFCCGGVSVYDDRYVHIWDMDLGFVSVFLQAVVCN